MPYSPATNNAMDAAAQGLPNQGFQSVVYWNQTAASTSVTGNYVYGIDYAVTTGTSSIVYNYMYSPNVAVNYINLNCTVEETAEQKASRIQLEAEAAIKRKAAESRAEELLIACLTEEQIKQYQQHGYFETDVNDKKYRINKGRSGNVYLIEAGKPKYKYCAHPHTMTPDQDVMLSQLLMLKTDEARFLATANRTQLM
jgi:hypothetical protein